MPPRAAITYMATGVGLLSPRARTHVDGTARAGDSHRRTDPVAAPVRSTMSRRAAEPTLESGGPNDLSAPRPGCG